MKTACFRVDGAPFMGIGHIMRCLTLADGLRARGWSVHFIVRDVPNHYGSVIEDRNYALHLLPFLGLSTPKLGAESSPPHSAWLGTDQTTDQEQTCTCLKAIKAPIDLMIIDHYGIDERWHKAMRPNIGQIMVLDDLADRPLECDVLLDQTFQRKPEEYKDHVPLQCRMLCGSDYMLLRPEFEQKRAQALSRRAATTNIKTVFICMGSADPDNLTSLILQGLEPLAPTHLLDISIIISSKAPHLSEVKAKAKASPHHVDILEDCTEMPEEMMKADIAFGAGGTMSWERCCLGLPTILAVIAENQKLIAHNLKTAGAVLSLGHKTEITPSHIQAAILSVITQPQRLEDMTQACTNICDGKGTNRVLDILDDPIF